jgi:hypothetical protein
MWGARTGDEHRADHEVGTGKLVFEGKRRGEHGANASREGSVELAQAVRVAVEDDNVRAEARRDPRRMGADDTAADDDDPSKAHPRNAAEEDPAAAFGPLEAGPPAWAASLPATSLIGANSGNRPRASSIVSQAMQVAPESISPRVARNRPNLTERPKRNLTEVCS